MKLFVAPRAPNPRRVLVFLAEKGITSIELVGVDLNAAIQAKYGAGCPGCGKFVCTCDDSEKP